MHYDVLVLGSGPAGFYCALHCSRLGRKTILVERDRLGGTGFRWGCLPVKMMLDRVRTGMEVDGSASLIPDTARRIQEVEIPIQRRLAGRISGRRDSHQPPGDTGIDRSSGTSADSWRRCGGDRVRLPVRPPWQPDHRNREGEPDSSGHRLRPGRVNRAGSIGSWRQPEDRSRGQRLAPSPGEQPFA